MGLPTRPAVSAMPRLGLGTMRKHGDEARTLVTDSLAAGYRHVDTGQFYDNEEAVGQGLHASGVPRDEIWVTTKFLHPKSPASADVHAAAESSLRRLGVDYVDALLVHWPNAHVPLAQAVEALGRFRDDGKARTVGVCNVSSALLRDALAVLPDLDIVQVEYHPYLGQAAVRQLVLERGLVLTAHSPLALGRVLDDDVIADIAAAHGASPAQVALRWLVQQDRVAAIPGGSPEHRSHLEENLEVLGMELGPDEMERISALARGLRVVDPPHAPDWDD